MEIQRAENLGPLHHALGIARDARITFRLAESGIIIWDLTAGTRYTIQNGNPTPGLASFQIPHNVQVIISESDDELRKRWAESWQDGWSDERETIFTELTYRGLSVPGISTT